MIGLMMEQDTVAKLNNFLKGIHMGLHGFKNHSEKTSNPNVIAVFKDVYTTYEGHENLMTKKIEELGGTPHHGLGVMGGAFQVVENIKELTIQDEKGLINKAKSDLETAIKMSNKFIDDNPTLPEEIVTIVRGIIKDNEDLLQRVNNL